MLAGNGKIDGIPDMAEEMLIVDPLWPSQFELAGCTACVPDCASAVCLLPGGAAGYSIENVPDAVTAVTVASIGALSCVNNVSVGVDAVATCAGGTVGGDTADQTAITGLDGSTKWRGGVLAGNGKIYGIPDGATVVLIMVLYRLAARCHGVNRCHGMPCVRATL